MFDFSNPVLKKATRILRNLKAYSSMLKGIMGCSKLALLMRSSCCLRVGLLFSKQLVGWQLGYFSIQIR